MFNFENKISLKTFIQFFLVYIVLACNNNKNVPKNLINEEDMAYYIARLQLLETQVNRSSFNVKDSVKIAYLNLAEKLLEEKNYDTVQYRISYEYYSKQPEQFVRIYDKAISILEAERNEGKPSNNTDIQRAR